MVQSRSADTEPTLTPSGDWVDISYASDRLGFDSWTILRLINDGDLPAIQVKGQVRTAHKLPRGLIDEARAQVMAGGQVELRAFARRWCAQQARSSATMSSADAEESESSGTQPTRVSEGAA
jgi:hypothetical protein